MERHAQDLLGVRFAEHPDGRRWTRHKAWDADDFPLRSDYPVSGRSTRRAPADADYPFTRVAGSGVYEIPVGPVHAGVIEPGHFRFQAVGETVLALEERLGYVHKGIEKIAVGRDPQGLARLAGRVSGDTTVAHAWAACMAMERAVGVSAPPRAAFIRAVLAERERVANHLGDIGAICNDVAFSFAHMQFGRLREWWQRENQRGFGHRLLMDCIVPGGVTEAASPDWLAGFRRQNDVLAGELDQLLPILEDYPSLEDRLEDTGVLGVEPARRLGAVGFVGKASGVDYDVRRDHGYAPYDAMIVQSPVLSEGDVAARMQIRIAEIRQSLDLLNALLQCPPDGAAIEPWPRLPGSGDGIGLVEGWRGEILTYVRFGEDGRVARFFPRDPSWFSWPALEQLIDGNIVPDFPVCNKSVNGSYSGQDL
jgi:Ni,Fe-hydrogenase III large subunit